MILGCKDKDDRCKEWAEWGECKNNPDWMLANCKKSCKQCGGKTGRKTVKNGVAAIVIWQAN